MITLVLPYPISANRYWATRVIKAKATGRYMAMTYATPEAKAYQEQTQWIARAAGVLKPLAGRVEIEYDLYPDRPLDWAKRCKKDPEGWANTVRCIDLGNAEKVMSDALNGAVIEDDKWIWRILGQKMEPDERGARLVVRIMPRASTTPQQSLV